MIDKVRDASLSSNIISVSTHLYKRIVSPFVGPLVCWSVGDAFFLWRKTQNPNLSSDINITITIATTTTTTNTTTTAETTQHWSIKPLKAEIMLQDTLGPISHYIINTTNTTTTNHHCYTLWTHRWSRAGLVRCVHASL